MPYSVTWSEIALRLACTVLAGALIGINRTERGRPAGLRTNILVCLAASISMIQANLLIPTNGKPTDSFVVFDLMRFPLGILTGMGFIGAGAIVRRGDMVQGVTTAATLWLVTGIGLCMGGGQIELGLAALALALIVLWGLKRLEQTFRQDRHATLIVCVTAEGPSEETIRATILAAGYRIGSWDVAYKLRQGLELRHLVCEVRWHGRPGAIETPAFLTELRQGPGTRLVRWSEAQRLNAV